MTNKYKQAVAQVLGCQKENTTLYFKGRVALYAILKALNIQLHDEVIVPAFTCVAAVNPIIYLGARPVYVDIESRTYTIDPKKIEDTITPKTKAILAQNTFGLSADLDSIIEIAKRHQIWVIEDCAQGFGGFYKARPNGTIGDASFFSTQWNKPFSTGLGGIAFTRNHQILENLKIMERNFVKPPLIERAILRMLIILRDGFLTTDNYWVALKTWRWLSNHNLILGSSQRGELRKPKKPNNFEKAFSAIQAKKGVKELKKIKKTLEHRRKAAEFYNKILIGLNIETPYCPDYAIHTFLRYPLLVKNRAKFFLQAQKNRIEIGDWFLSPIHPIIKNYEYWYYQWEKNPIAEKISQHIVNLPTHLKIDEVYIDKIGDFLKINKNNIINSYNEL